MIAIPTRTQRDPDPVYDDTHTRLYPAFPDYPLTWEATARLYNIRHPNLPAVHAHQARSIGYIALRKIKRQLSLPDEVNHADDHSDRGLDLR